MRSDNNTQLGQRNWSCPICREALVPIVGALKCPEGHSYDLSTTGYTNFLTGKRPSPELGDSSSMLQARRRFLNAGYYAPLVSHLQEMIDATFRVLDGNRTNKPFRIVEAGSGEGYYLGTLAERFPRATSMGFDVAKAGVKLSAQAYPDVEWAVADTTQRLPIASKSVQVLLNIFAPRNAVEFERILVPGGKLIVVIPDTHHLEELRPWIDILKIQPDKSRLIQTQFKALRLKAERSLTISLGNSPQLISDLIGMSPSARFLHEETKLVVPARITPSARFHLLQLVKDTTDNK